MDNTLQVVTEKVKSSNILYGKKTVLFPIAATDLPQMVRLHRGDKQGYLMRYCLKDMSVEEATRYLAALLLTGQLNGWSVYNKQGRKAACVGFIYLSDISEHTAELTGVLDRAAVKGLGRTRGKEKASYAEDASRAVLTHCFGPVGLSRVVSHLRADNRLALLLNRKIGWVPEGTLRGAYENGHGPKDVVILGLLRGEWHG